MNIFVIFTPSENKEVFNDVYKTLKIGFPTSNVYKVNNYKLERHHNIIKDTLQFNSDPTVICDTDVIFYDNVEEKLKPIDDCLLAGRLIPNYYNEVLQCNEVKRYHTSLLYFPRPKELMDTLKDVTQHHNYPLNIFDPFQYYLNTTRFFYDTCANLYHSIEKDKLFDFRPDILDCYSHIGCGSIFDIVGDRLRNKQRLLMQHKLAKDDPNSLRYLWKEQEIYYKSHPTKFIL